MSLVDSIIERVIEVTRVGRARIVVSGVFGVSCEGWLKVELLKGLWEMLGDSPEQEILPEADNIDLAVKADRQWVRIELKTFPTNYGRSGKPMTNFIDGVIRDLSKLEGRSEPDSVGLAVWLAYPIPEPVPHHWPIHLARVEAAAAATLRAEKIPLWENNFAHLYFMRSR